MADPKNAASPFDFDFTKMMADLKMPGVDALVDGQRRNLEAMTAANKAAMDGVQAVMQRQAEILRESLTEAAKAAQDNAAAPANPQEAVTKQAELVRAAFEKNVANMKELAELMAKANTEAYEVLNKRFQEVMDDMQKAGK